MFGLYSQTDPLTFWTSDDVLFIANFQKATKTLFTTYTHEQKALYATKHSLRFHRIFPLCLQCILNYLDAPSKKNVFSTVNRNELTHIILRESIKYSPR